MSMLSMVLNPIIKDIENNPKIQAAVIEIEAAESRVLPILQKIDPALLATALASLSGGRITPAEAQTIELELVNVFQAIQKLFEEAKGLAKK